MSRLWDILAGIITFIPLVVLILYWYAAYCVWNAMLTATQVWPGIANALLFVLMILCGLVITVILLVLFILMLSALIE